jgi:hypothetical protein
MMRESKKIIKQWSNEKKNQRNIVERSEKDQRKIPENSEKARLRV